MSRNKIPKFTRENAPIVMPKATLRKWLAALRSGEYRQTGSVMFNPDNHSFCALGVLEHVIDGGVEVYGDPKTSNDFCCVPSSQYLRERNIQFKDQYGCICDAPSVHTTRKVESLVALNDKGTRFKVLADIIERNAVGI